jgi:putative flippase GtrA
MHNKNLPPIQFLSFIIAGLINTIWVYAVFALFIYFGVHYTLATFIAGVVGVLSGYKIHRHYVFTFTGTGRLSRFVIVFGVMYLASIAIQALLAESGWVVNSYANGAVALTVCAMVSFALNKYFVFR